MEGIKINRKEVQKMNIEEELHETQAKLKEGYKHIKEGASQFRNRANDSLNEGLKDFRDRASIYQEDAMEVLDSLSAYIKENPQRSAIIAGGIGVGVGLFLALFMRGGRR